MEDLENLNKALKKFKNGYKNEVQKFANGQSNKFLALVKPRTPVDTGELRNNWVCNTVVGNKDVYLQIRNTSDYASFVEYGHRQHPGQYVAKIGKRLKASYVKGRYMMTRSVNDILEGAEKDFDTRINRFSKECGLQ